MVKRILAAYQAHLLRSDLSAPTVAGHTRWASRFMAYLSSDATELGAVRIEHVDAFLGRWLPCLGRRTRHASVSSLRKLLAFLHQVSITEVDLSPLVMGVRIYRDTALPKGLSRDQVRQILAQVDRDVPNGRRDYAILLLLAVYGLRVSEVVSLRLDSIDWRGDRIRLDRPKTRDVLDLPLLPEVGNAILDYLRQDGPSTSKPELFFLPQKHSTRPIIDLVKRHLRAAGIETSGPITAAFRHGLAMELVARSVPLKSIADTLGHRHLASTYVYARTDVERLRGAALAPPAGEPAPSKVESGAIPKRREPGSRREPRGREITSIRGEPFKSYLAPEFLEYLALKRATGRVYDYEEYMLRRLDRFLVENNASLSADSFHAWLQSLGHLHSTTQSHYYNQVRQFCEYRRRADPFAFVPDRRFEPLPQPTRMPIVLNVDEVTRLFALVDSAPAESGPPLWWKNFRMITTLLYCCGLRVGEVLRLDVGDVNLGTGVLTVRNAKFYKSRLVPMDDAVTERMSYYLGHRQRSGLPETPDAPLFCSSRAKRHFGRRYFKNTVKDAMKRRLIAAGIRAGERRVRVHDLRHTFAVHRLTQWYHQGEDVQAKLPILSQYMGHVDIAYTQKYLPLIPELCAAAMQRFGAYAVPLRKPSDEE